MNSTAQPSQEKLMCPSHGGTKLLMSKANKSNLREDPEATILTETHGYMPLPGIGASHQYRPSSEGHSINILKGFNKQQDTD